MADKDTLFDTIINKIKNNKPIALILVAAVVIVAVIGFLSTVLEDAGTIGDTLFPQKEKVQIVVSIQPYNIISEITQPDTELSPIEIVGNDTNSVVESITNQILTIIQPKSISKIDLEIQGNRLYASEWLVATISYYQSPIQQSLEKELGENNLLDLEDIFQNPSIFNPTCNCIDLAIRDAMGNIEAESLRIFSNQDNFSFESDDKVVSKSIQTKTKKIRIIIEPFTVDGISSDTGNQVKFSIENGIRQVLKSNDFIEVSPLTRQALQEKREELKLLSPGGKLPIVEQYNVDFIVSGKIIVTNEP